MKKLNFFPLKIKTFTLGNIINNNIDCFLFGNNISNSFNFLYYFTLDINNENIEKNNKFIKYWNYLPNKEINYILPLKNAEKNNSILIFDSQINKMNLNENNNNNYNNKILIDDELYISPSINNNKIYGIINYQGLKIFNLENNNYYILYPGKKNTINDYCVNNNNNNLVISTSDKKLIDFDFRDKKTNVSWKHKFSFDKIIINNNDIISYSNEIEKILLYDVRNLNKFKDVIKNNVNINKMILNENNLFYYDLYNYEIISINIQNKIEKCFDFNNNENEIKNFDFDAINKKYFYIQNSDKEIIIFNNNNNNIKNI
jgi:hypothetical protein